MRIRQSQFYTVYITSNPGRTVFYTGVTNDLKNRLRQHYDNRGSNNTFAGRYYCYELVCYIHFNDINLAIAKEKEIKDLSREKKMELIKSLNPKLTTLKV